MKLKLKYSIRFKLKCLELVKVLGIYRTSIIIGINRKSIREWYLNSQKYLDIVKKNSTYRLPGAGPKVKYAKKEDEIALFVIRCKEIGLSLNTKSIIEEYCRICPNMKQYSKHTLKKWCYSFLKRNNYYISDFQKVKY